MNKIKQTITSVLLVTLFSAFAMSANASSCRWIGNFLYCDDGFGGSLVGNHFYGNDGSTVSRIGNTYYFD